MTTMTGSMVNEMERVGRVWRLGLWDLGRSLLFVAAPQKVREIPYSGCASSSSAA
ncbi:MAG: hypothetical protein IAF00_09180 [Phycisphaerales bacterium]|nr:hypothetical protein [Phycisphaerales bacterium]